MENTTQLTHTHTRTLTHIHMHAIIDVGKKKEAAPLRSVRE